ncbi:MAG: DsrE family protein [Methanothrix sp.]|nr:DsrE family protein [Methanothrix sp.]
MRSIFYLLDSAPYGSEKAFGLLNAAAVSIRMDVAVGLYADGVFLALAGQDSQALKVPNLSDIIYAYPEIRFLAHEPSLAERDLLSQSLTERVELLDEELFLNEVLASESVVIL